MCSAPVGPDFATNGEQTATNPFPAVYGERAQLLTVHMQNITNMLDIRHKVSFYMLTVVF